MATSVEQPVIHTLPEGGIEGITEGIEELRPSEIQRHMRVKADSNVRKVAGSICHSCRGSFEIMKTESRSPTTLETAELACEVVAAGNTAINQAIKSIAIARMWLANEGIYMIVKPCFEPLGAMQFQMFIHFNAEEAALEMEDIPSHSKKEVEEAKEEETGKITQMRVASTTDPYNLAGAVATVIRDTPGPHKLQLSAQGSNAVSQTARALVYSRGYLQPDNIDLGFQPFFSIAKMQSGEERSILRFEVSRFPSEQV